MTTDHQGAELLAFEDFARYHPLSAALIKSPQHARTTEDHLSIAESLRTWRAFRGAWFAAWNRRSAPSVASQNPAAVINNAGSLQQVHGYTDPQQSIASSSARAAAEHYGAIAWVRCHPNGHPTEEVLPNRIIEPERKRSGAWLPLGLLNPPAAGGDGLPELPQPETLQLSPRRLLFTADQMRQYARDALAAGTGDPALRRAAELTREDLGWSGANYPQVRILLAFAEAALGIAPPSDSAAEGGGENGNG